MIFTKKLPMPRKLIQFLYDGAFAKPSQPQIPKYLYLRHTLLFSININSMKSFFRFILVAGLLLNTTNCHKFNPEDYPLSTQINSFIWKAMNNYYLWQEDVPVLADARFHTDEELYEYANDYSDPEAFFESLIYQRDVIDKWSWIVNDYVALEAYFNGVRKTSGARFKLHLMNEGSDKVFGMVRYILPGTDAADKPIHRGDVFNSVNGTILTKSNYKDLLYNSDSYTLNLGDLNYDADTGILSITPNGNDVSLTNEAYNENPVYIKKTFTTGAHTIGYLMYNSFTSTYDSDLNNAFQYFKNEGVTDLIIDLRYNGGGSVRTAGYLCSMITGQFNDQILTQEQWNPKLQKWISENHPDWLINKFTNTMSDGTSIVNLHLNRVIVLTTRYTASASELVINALNPYIDVVKVGSTTHGKYVASITLYDSDDFTKTHANPEHQWAIQPIVLKEINKLGNYAVNGFEPDIGIEENYLDMGELGNEDEPLTATAIAYIVNGDKTGYAGRTDKANCNRKSIDSDNQLENQMYIENSDKLQAILFETQFPYYEN